MSSFQKSFLILFFGFVASLLVFFSQTIFSRSEKNNAVAAGKECKCGFIHITRTLTAESVEKCCQTCGGEQYVHFDGALNDCKAISEQAEQAKQAEQKGRCECNDGVWSDQITKSFCEDKKGFCEYHEGLKSWTPASQISPESTTPYREEMDVTTVQSFFHFDTSSPVGWVNSIYRYGIVAISLFAAAGIIYGGIRYLTSLGNPEAITSAKNAIFSAIAGLVLLLLSHTILNTLDPRLVNLKLTTRKIFLPTKTCEGEGRSTCKEGEVCLGGWCRSEKSLKGCDGVGDNCSIGSCCPGLRCNTDGWNSCEIDPNSPLASIMDDCEGEGGWCTADKCCPGLYCETDETPDTCRIKR